MAEGKEAYQLELYSEQMDFLRSTKEKYDIRDESKVVRIMVNYLLSTPDIHATVFDETRCLWCG